MSQYDPDAPMAQRYPRVTTPEQMDAAPRLKFNDGIYTNIFISAEGEDARYFRHGICYAEAGHKTYRWEQWGFDESHFVLEGKVRLRVEDADGRVIYLEATAGEHIFLPAGYIYELEDTGGMKFYWTSGPSNRNGLVEVPDYSATLRAQRS